MIEVFELIYAWAVGTLGRDRAHEIVWPFLDRLTQTSPETAAWGALKQVGLPKHAAHLKALVRTVETIPTIRRPGPTANTRTTHPWKSNVMQTMGQCWHA